MLGARGSRLDPRCLVVCHSDWEMSPCGGAMSVSPVTCVARPFSARSRRAAFRSRSCPCNLRMRFRCKARSPRSQGRVCRINLVRDAPADRGYERRKTNKLERKYLSLFFLPLMTSLKKLSETGWARAMPLPAPGFFHWNSAISLECWRCKEWHSLL